MDIQIVKQGITELLATADPGGAGLGLGKIADKFFFESTWAPRLSEPMGKVQYAKFVAIVIHRIRGEESCVREIHRFAELLSTERDHEFMKSAVPLIPELRHDMQAISYQELYSMLMVSSPQIQGRWQMPLLVTLIVSILRDRYPEYSYTAKRKENTGEGAKEKTEGKTSGHGLRKDELDQIKKLLCGPGGGAGGGARIDRFVRSFVEMGYPQAALEESQRVAQGRGQSIERDSEGLPMNLKLPPIKMCIEPSGAASSSSNESHPPIPTAKYATGRDSPPKELPNKVNPSSVANDETSDSWSDCSTVKGSVSDGKKSAFKEDLRG